MLIIDRFESDYAVCESDTGDIINIPRQSIESGAREGDAITPAENGFYTVDRMLTERRSKQINAKLKKLLKE